VPDSDLIGVDVALTAHGWAMLPARIAPDVLGCLRPALDAACACQRDIRRRNGVADGAEGTAHHLPCAGGSFLDLLEADHGQSALAAYFQGPYILNTYGGLLNPPNETVYVSQVHRDQRTFTGELRLMAQLLVMLDDFTADNGATYLLSGSHRLRDKPSDEAFFKDAVRATGTAGSIIIFDSNLWHAAGANRTDRPRRALTLAFTRPFVKQQLDYPRALGYERGASLSPNLRQLLGYNARVPVTLDEWYQPADRRLYRRDQG
jgi:phytanoyl-CoA dioxygenase PhyH